MLGIAAAIIAQATVQPDFVVPIEPGQILAIHAPLGGKDAIFAIDTGSFDLLVKPSAAGTNDKTTQINLDFLSASPVEAKVEGFPFPSQGIIGLNDLHQKAMGIDATDGALSFWNAGNLSSDQVNYWFSHTADFANKGSWSSVTLIPYNQVNLEDSGDGRFFVDGMINGTPAKFGIDTDDAISAVDGSAIGTTGFLSLADSVFGGIRHPWQVHVGIVDSITFASDEMKQMPMVETPNGSLSTAQGLLGYDFFMDRRVILDFPAHKLYFSDPPAVTRGREALLAYGIRLVPFVKGHQFIAVVPDSIAAKAGMHSGDEVVSVGGQPVSAENAAKTGSSLPFDYSKSGLPKSLSIVAKTANSQSTTYSLNLS